MNIIVTGGAGFIGSNFIFYEMKTHPEDRIICLDSLTYAGNLSTLKPVLDKPNFRFVKESITDREAVERLFKEEKPDIVVNFAAESHVDRSIVNPDIFLETNIHGTTILMDACRKYGIAASTRSLPTRYTAIFRLTVRTSSSMRIPRFIPPARIPVQRRPRICLSWHTTERSVSRSRSPDAPTTTDRTSSRRSSFR